MAISITVKYYRSEIKPNLQSYDLQVVVESAVGMPKEIFVFQRNVQPALPANIVSGIPQDQFISLADPVDLEEFPTNQPDLAHEIPYFRVASVTLRFRDLTLLEETQAFIAQDIQDLVDALKAAANVALVEEVTYA
jgi:hypothetical protein